MSGGTPYPNAAAEKEVLIFVLQTIGYKQATC